MQNDPDYQMALLLQQQFNTEFNVENPSQDLSYSNHKKKKILSKEKSLTDPSWEVIDPTPNIFILFVQFNEKFFWNKLGSVAVSWSKRMTTCAGICSYQGRGGLCHITLSEPLLKLRPRKDLIETLLHEMIHAFLFVTHNNRDRDGHGPEFHKHMYRINGEAGTNITVYHNFHDEVRLYQQHWWRCDGPCQKRPPYFGMVRRAMNRAPGPYDRWFAGHQQTCGGNFIKVKEPEKNNKKTEKNNNKLNKTTTSPNKRNSPTKTKLPDIRNFLPPVNGNKSTGKENIQTINNIQSKGGLGTKNKNGTVVLNPKNSAKSNDLSVSSVIPSSSNIHGFSKDADKVPSRNNVEVFSGPGRKLSSSSTDSNKTPDISAVRNHWANKFTNPGPSNTKPVKRKSLNFETEINKKSKNETEIISNKVKNDTEIVKSGISCPNCSETFAETEINSHLDSCLSADDSIKSEFSNDSISTMVECPVCNTFIEEESLNNHLDECLISDNKVENSNDTSKSDNKIEDSNDTSKSDKKLCELCNSQVDSDKYTLHIQDCLSKYYDNMEQDLDIAPPTSDSVLCLVCNKTIVKDCLNDHLEDCMGSVFDKDKFTQGNNDDDDEDDDEPLNKTIYNCPICMESLDESIMNSHIDECLNTDVIKNEFS